MSRPHNVQLNNVLVSYDDPEGETIQNRPSNPALMGLLAPTNDELNPKINDSETALFKWLSVLLLIYTVANADDVNAVESKVVG